MQLPALALTLILLVGAVSVPEPTAQTPQPQRANITAACTGSGNGSVNPPRINMRRTDHIAWSTNSDLVASFTITPKEAENWPFAASSFAGTPQEPAVTPQPLASALENHSYAYNVTVICTDGTVEVIDPDIIIGSGT
jgi:hypothetical protein